MKRIESRADIYVGCPIKDGCVVKVNEKSYYMYPGNWKDIKEKMDLKTGTWKDFCKINGIKMVKYGEEYFVEESEIGKGEIIENNTFKVDKAEELVIKELEKNAIAKKRSVNLSQAMVGSKMLRIIDNKDGAYLLNLNNDYVLYDSRNSEACKICSVYEYNYPKIPWERLSRYSMVN